MNKRKMFGVIATVTAMTGMGAIYIETTRDTSHVSDASSKDIATPVTFTQAEAMLSVYGDYNGQHKGTLIPVKNTETWQLKDSDELATPILTAMYEEGSQRKAVLAVQRQLIIDGAVQDSHATGATISVYVFRLDGTDWILEKGDDSVAEAGAHGQAPDAKLIRIGDKKYGLLFEGGDVHQGYTHDYMLLVSLSEAAIPVVLQEATGESNSGACSELAEEIEKSNGLLKKCWSHQAKIAFFKKEDSSYYAIQVINEGTAENEKDETVIPFRQVTNYRMTDGEFKPITDPSHQDGILLPEHEVYDVGSVQTRAITMPTSPRKLLK